MEKQFTEYVLHPITGTSLVSPLPMKTLRFPLIKDYAPQANQTAYAYADCYNILYVGKEGNSEYRDQLILTVIDTLGINNPIRLTFGSIINGQQGLNYQLTHGRYYISEACTMTPTEISNATLTGSKILGNMPGAIWVNGSGLEGEAWGDTVINADSPLYGKPRFELQIENAYFYLTTSSIGSLINNLTWAFEEGTVLPLNQKVGKYGQGSYGIYDEVAQRWKGYNGSDQAYAKYPSLRTGKPFRALDSLPFRDSSTQPIENTVVRRTDQGTIAPGTCGYRLTITIPFADWTGNDETGRTCVVSDNTTYIKTMFDVTNGDKIEDSNALSRIITKDSIVYCYFADSTSFDSAFNAHVSPSVGVDNGTLTFTSVKKPLTDITLNLIVF